MRIGNNISAMNTLNRLTVNNSMLSKSLEKLSSGSAINRAADNAAGLAISEKMRAQIAGLEQASKNAQDGISLVQTAEGALDQTHTALRRMYTLAMQAKNGTITDEDRQKIQDEINARINEIDRVAETSNFNGIKLFNGDLDETAAGGKALELQIGATAADEDKIEVSIRKMDAASLLVKDDDTSGLTDLSDAGDGSLMSLDMRTADAASDAIGYINNAIERVSTQRAALGAVQNRLEQTIENLSTTAENMSAAESRIRDVDMAKEMTTFTKYSILSQAAQAMLAQANALPQGVLQLLG